MRTAYNGDIRIVTYCPRPAVSLARSEGLQARAELMNINIIFKIRARTSLILRTPPSWMSAYGPVPYTLRIRNQPPVLQFHCIASYLVSCACSNTTVLKCLSNMNLRRWLYNIYEYDVLKGRFFSDRHKILNSQTIFYLYRYCACTLFNYLPRALAKKSLLVWRYPAPLS